jgi:hypothetical protein
MSRALIERAMKTLKDEDVVVDPLLKGADVVFEYRRMRVIRLHKDGLYYPQELTPRFARLFWEYIPVSKYYSLGDKRIMKKYKTLRAAKFFAKECVVPTYDYYKLTNMEYRRIYDECKAPSYVYYNEKEDKILLVSKKDFLDFDPGSDWAVIVG